MTLPFVSIVIPVRNSEAILGECLRSLKKLDYPPDRYEIIIADSVSTDRTREIARDYGARVVSTEKRSVCAGRNVGFSTAKGELVAFSDADCVMAPDWLKNAVKYFADERVAGIGGPNLVPGDDPPFSQAVDVQFAYARHLIGAAPVRVMSRVIESRAHGSNVIYRKNVLDRVMPMCESLIEGEDVEMNNRIVKLGYKLLYVPDVVVWHKRRTTPRKWFRQMYGYGIGRYLVGKRDPFALNLSHLIGGLIIPLFLVTILVGLLWIPIVLSVLGALIIIFLAAAFGLALADKKQFQVALWFPVVAGLAAAGWSIGFLRAWWNPKTLKR